MPIHEVKGICIGQESSTVTAVAKRGLYYPLKGIDSRPMVCINARGEHVCPPFNDAWDPTTKPNQHVAVHVGDKKYEGVMIGSFSESRYNGNSITLAIEGRGTVVFKNWDALYFQTTAKPANISVADATGMEVNYNTTNITWSPYYKVFVTSGKAGKITRVELWADIRNETGETVRPNSGTDTLKFKITRAANATIPHHAYRAKGIQLESVAYAAAAPVSSAARSVHTSALGESESFSVPAQDIEPGQSQIIIRHITEVEHEKLFWYFLNGNNLQWGFRIVAGNFYPSGQVYVIDDATHSTIDDGNITIDATVAGKPLDIVIGAPTGTSREVGEKVEDTEETCTKTYLTPADYEGAKTLYVLTGESGADIKVNPEVPFKNGKREFPAGTIITVRRNKPKKDSKNSC